MRSSRTYVASFVLGLCLTGGWSLAENPPAPIPPRPAAGGIAGGESGGGGFGALGTLFPGVQVPLGPVGNDRSVEADSLLVAVSKSGKTLWGFNDAEGRWVSQKVEGTPVDPRHLVVGSGVAIVVAGNKAYGFGARSRAWGVTTLVGVAADTPAAPVVGFDVGCVAAGTKVHAFGADSDRFETVDVGPLDEGKPVAPTIGRRRVRVDCQGRIHVYTNGGPGWSTIQLEQDE